MFFCVVRLYKVAMTDENILRGLQRLQIDIKIFCILKLNHIIHWVKANIQLWEKMCKSLAWQMKKKKMSICLQYKKTVLRK